jgi:pyridoxine kinase
MGDDGALYIAEEVVPVYKSIIPHADVILPNQFEAELLSDYKISNIDDISVCLGILHQRYKVPHIVLSSLRLSSHENVILCCGSTCTEDLKPRPFIIEAPIIDGPFVGTGDLFASLLLAQLHPFHSNLRPESCLATELPLAKALEVVIASMQGVLNNTRIAMEREIERDEELKKWMAVKSDVPYRHRNGAYRIMRAAELRLVASQNELLAPGIVSRAVAL